MVSWLEKLDSGAYAYGVRMTCCAPGQEWSEPFWLHEDQKPVEHGFTTFTPLPSGQVHAVWLDGREMLDGDGDLDHSGAMSLFARVIEPDGTLGPEYCLDDRVCECCQTDATLLPDGRVLVVWRDRSEEEVRDIHYSVGDPLDPSSWTESARLAADGWRIPGCPVNGPSVTVTSDQVFVAWYTQDEEQAHVYVCRSGLDLEFSTPIKIDGGKAMGRVDTCALKSGQLVVTWLEGTQGRAHWKARCLGAQGDPGPAVVVGTVTGTREDGFLRMAPKGTGILAAYFDARTKAGILKSIELQR